jgi:hypothetical protein
MGSLVTIEECGSTQDAELLKSYLDAAGIECVLQGAHHLGVAPYLGNIMSVRVLVPAAQEETAREVLKQRREGQRIPDEELAAEALAAGRAPADHLRVAQPSSSRAALWVVFGVVVAALAVLLLARR